MEAGLEGQATGGAPRRSIEGKRYALGPEQVEAPAVRPEPDGAIQLDPVGEGGSGAARDTAVSRTIEPFGYLLDCRTSLVPHSSTLTGCFRSVAPGL